MSVQATTVTVDGIEAEVIRKPIKRIYVRVKAPSGRVVVTAPARVPQHDIVKLLRERHSWILQAQQRIASRPVGRQEEWTPEHIEEAKAAMNTALVPLLHHWVPIVGQSPTDISLRRMKTRWGSCTPSTGRIRLNLELAYLPPEFLEYVLVHELTHLWERGHGVGFQRRMTQYLPHWRELRKRLNQVVL